MRSFVITQPGLSVGKPGTYLTAAELRMDDDKLDAFVEAGYAIEIHNDGEPRGRMYVDAPDDVELDDLALGPWEEISSSVVPLLAAEDSDALAIDTTRHPSAQRPKRRRKVT